MSITINKCSHNQKAAHPEAVAFVDPDPVALGRFLCRSQDMCYKNIVQIYTYQSKSLGRLGL